MNTCDVNAAAKVKLAYSYVRALRKHDRLQAKANEALLHVRQLETAINAPGVTPDTINEVSIKETEPTAELWS